MGFLCQHGGRLLKSGVSKEKMKYIGESTKIGIRNVGTDALQYAY